MKWEHFLVLLWIAGVALTLGGAFAFDTRLGCIALGLWLYRVSIVAHR